MQGAVDNITQLMQRLYNQRCQLSNSLGGIAEADGPRVTGEILALQNQYNALAEKRWQLVAGESVAEITLPEQSPTAEQPAASVADRGELLQQRANLRSPLSKTKGKLAKATSEVKKAELTQKIGVLTVELANFDMQLALPQA